jgi:hypothetical protein
MSLEILQLSNYVRPEIKESASKDFVLNGDKNSFYQEIIDRYNGSATNRAIIDAYAQYIYGKGLTSNQKSTKAIQFADILRILSKKDLKNVCQDYSLFGEASIEIIFKGGNVMQIKHTPKNCIVPNKMDENGDVKSYWYSRDFSQPRKYDPIQIPAFGFDTIKNGSAIYIISDYQVGKTYFSDPTYLSGMPYAVFEEEYSNFVVNHIKNGLSFGHIINFNDGADKTEEQKKAIFDSFRQNLAGSTNAGKFVLAYNDNKENSVTIEALTVSDAHKQYEFLTADAMQKIMLSHRVTSPILFGIKDATGFGNNADEMQVAFDELMLNVIQPKQEVILDALMFVLNQNGFNIDLDFIPLRPKTTSEQHTQLSKQVQERSFEDIELDLANYGETLDENEWELVSSNPVDFETEEQLDKELETLNKVTLGLANVALAVSTGVAKTKSVSELDTKLYITRYRYGGNPNPERAFCKAMMRANKLYRKEDIAAMSQRNVNPGFGMRPNPNQPYDILLWKGGGLLSDEFPHGTCRHFWMREMYRKIGSGKNTAAQPSTAADVRKAGEIAPTINPKAYIAPHDM